MRALATLLVVAVAVAAVPVARADDELAEAERLKAALDYQDALAIVDRLLARGGAAPDRLAQLQLLAGTLAAGLDRPALAEDHFARLLAIDPGATLPPGTSPKITAPFDAARTRTTPLHVSARVADGVVALALGADPLELVVGIEVDAVDASGRHLEIADGRATRVALPPGVRVHEVRALDATGNRVWVGPASGEPGVPAAAQAPVPATAPTPAVARVAVSRPAPTPSPGLARRWSTWAALGGVALATGGFAAWRFEVAQTDWNTLRAEDDQHDYSALQAVEQRSRHWALAANIGFGVAAAAAVTTAIVFATRPHASHLSVAVGPTGVGLAGRF